MHSKTPYDSIFGTFIHSRPNSLVWWTAGIAEPYHDKLAYTTLWQWRNTLTERMRNGMQSLHLKPKWDEFLVFDIDVRATTAVKPPDEIRAVLGCTHAASAPICAKCWPIAQAACFLADEWITKNFGLPAPLTVFSGSGGIHLWYSLRDDVDAAIAFTGQRVRQAIVGIWNSTPLPDGLAEAVPLFRRADASTWRPLLDQNVTAQPRHAIRMPFSRNEKTGRYALPLLHSPLPEWPATDDVDTGAQRFVEWAEFV
jgi:DNA primase catalytic subunit